MKHFIALILLFLAIYAAWVFLPRPDRTKVKKVSRRHLKPVLFAVLVLLAGLVFAFYNRSINIL